MSSHADLKTLFSQGETARLALDTDWSRTPLGPPARWPQSLRTAVSLVMRARQPMLVAWGDELITIYNDAYISILGAKHPHAFGQPMSIVWAEVWDSAAPINDAVMAGESLWFKNMPFQLAGRGDAGLGYFSYSYTPLLDDRGTVRGLFCAAMETTETVLSEQRKAEEAERQRRLFEQAPGFICILRGPEHIFDFVNDAYQRLFGRTDIVGRSVRDVFPELDGQGFFERLDEVYQTGERYVATGVPARLHWDEGEREYLLDFVYAPIHDESGHVSGIFCEGHDVTGSHEARRMLEEREEQLRLATENAEIGLWDVDTVREKLFWPPRVKAMFGISAEHPVTMQDFYEGLHPQDRERVSAAFAAACDPQRRALYDVEYRTIGKEDRRLRWVAAKGRAVFDPPDRCVRVIGTAIDITARKSMEAAQREADQRKDEFIATLSHELRNPMAPLRSAVHLLRRRSRDEREASLVAMMDRQLAHLVRLVDDLLEVSRITQGTFELRTEVLDLRSVADVAIEATEPAMRDQGHTLAFAKSSEPLWVAGDAIRLTQLLSNLLTNAARYTPPGGSVHVSTGVQGDRAFVRVEDNGRGFTPEGRERMFEMFARSPDSQGLGIGLALSSQLARLHGGAIEAVSAGPGRGSSFTFQLPLAPQPSVARPVTSATEKTGAVRVLLVDDNADAAHTLRDLLEVDGHEVFVATSGEQALDIFSRAKPELVLLDIGMPGMDGYEVARRLRTAPGSPPLRIVALSGWGQERDREQGRAAGFDDHLVKPVEPDALARALAAARHAADRGSGNSRTDSA